ncbi:MAG: cyclic nucleotide-binding domain-containing protein [Deltaproteobacteria bacterium]|nr:MAG: cyclic nucleotide-binding domain-containing protein [Deltaproteobacteria bacterium]
MVDKEERTGVDLEQGPTALEISTYQDDQEIILEGDHTDRFYVVLSGKVKIVRRGRQLSILEVGDVFGLESSFLNHPSTITARAVDSARIATYSRDAMDFILYERPQLGRSILLSVLGQMSQTVRAVVRNDNEPALDDVNIRFYVDGEVIIREGLRETDIFKLVSTEQGLVVSKNGREVGLILTPGEFFGEMASVLNQERSATVTSRGNSVVQVYSAEHIQDMIEDHPEIARRMISALAKRLSHSIKKISRLQEVLEADN